MKKISILFVVALVVSIVPMQAQKGKNIPMAIAAQYDDAESFSEGLAVVRMGEKFGVIDKTGKMVVPCKYDQITPFSEGRAMVRVTDKKTGEARYGYIDREGKEVVEPKYAGARPFANGLAPVMQDPQRELWGYIDPEGNVVVPFRLKEAGQFSEGVAFINAKGTANGGGWEMMKYTPGGKSVGEKAGNVKRVKVAEGLDCRGSVFSDGYARVRVALAAAGEKGGEFCYIDTEGRVVIAREKFRKGEQAGDFCFFLAPIKVDTFTVGKNGQKSYCALWGFIDATGETVIPCKFSQVSAFEAKLAAARMGENEKMGYIGMGGDWVIKPQYDGAYMFSESYAVVMNGGKYGFINIEGDVMIAPRYEDAKSVTEGLAPVKEKGKWGYVKLY